MRFSCIEAGIEVMTERLRKAPLVKTETWQSLSTVGRPEMATYETRNCFFIGPMPSEDPAYYHDTIQPNLPWADQHFDERVSGEPLNPPPSWVNWPYAHSAANHLTAEKFSHTYPERMWPKTVHAKGIRFLPGDLHDLVGLLATHPLTRQAYLPIWFPEDTGVVHGERVPCTLGYHFLVRDDHLHIHYPIRSCDALRHFRDDVYMAVRLALWMLTQLRTRNAYFKNVKPGDFSMWIGSLHCFVNDRALLFGDNP